MDRNPCLIGESSFLDLSIKIESSERIFELAVEASDTIEVDIAGFERLAGVEAEGELFSEVLPPKPNTTRVSKKLSCEQYRLTEMELMSLAKKTKDKKGFWESVGSLRRYYLYFISII